MFFIKNYYLIADSFVQCIFMYDTFFSSSTLIARESISSPLMTFPTDGPVHNSSGMCTAEPIGELILSGVPPSLFLVLALLSKKKIIIYTQSDKD